MTAPRFLVSLLLLSAANAAWAAGPPEPFVQGKPLGYWLLLLHESEFRIPAPDPGHDLNAGPVRAMLALRRLGPDSAIALPALLAWHSERPNGNDDFLYQMLAASGPAARPALPILSAFYPRTFPRPSPYARSLPALKLDRTLQRLDPALHFRLMRRATPADVPDLLVQVREGTVKDRYQAAELLIEADPEQAGSVVPFLRQLLLAADREELKFEAAPERLLMRLEDRAREAIPLLAYRFDKESSVSLGTALAVLDPAKARTELRKKSAEVRRRVLHELVDNRLPAGVTLALQLLDLEDNALDAAEALAVLDREKATGAVPVVRFGLKSTDVRARLRCAALLPLIDPSRNSEVVAVLRVLLRPENGDLREAALKVLQRLGKETVPAWIDLLDDARWGYLALETLPRFGPDATPAVPALKTLLRHRDKVHSLRAAWALAIIEPAALKDEIPALKQALTDSSVAARELALLTLGRVGDRRAAPLLAERLGSKTHPGEVAAALYGLRQLGKAAAPALIARLQDADPQLRGNAARTLAALGPMAREVVPALGKLLHDSDKLVQLRAAHALARIDAPKQVDVAVKHLRHLMRGSDRIAREAAIRLGRLGREIDLTTEILAALDSDHPETAALALCAVGPRAGLVSPLLKKLYERPENPLRHPLVMRALIALGPAARSAVPAVLTAWKDEALRPTVEQTLAALGTPGPESVGPLRRLLKDKQLRPRVVEVLRDMGRDAKEAGEELIRLWEETAVEAILTPREIVLFSIKAHWTIVRDYRVGHVSPQDIALLRRGGKELVADLMKLLRSNPAEEERIGAFKALAGAGEAARDALPLLRAALKDKMTPDLTTAVVPAAWQLRSLGISERELVPGLRSMLTNPSKWMAREWAAQRLSEIGKEGLVAEHELLNVVKTREDDSAALAALALIRLGKKDRTLIEPLLRLLDDRTVEPGPVLEALEILGPMAREASGRLHARLTRSLGDSRTLAPSFVAGLVRAALRIDPKEAKRLENLLTQRLSSHLLACADGLAELGELGRGAVPTLIVHHRKLGWHEARAPILKALAAIGPDSKARIEALAQSGKKLHSDWEILSAWGARAREAVPLLVRTLAGEMEDVELGFEGVALQRNCRTLAEVLGNIGPDAKEAVSVLKRMHQRKEPELYLAAARALRRINPDTARQMGIPRE